MASSFDTDELVRTIVDQAHQNRRLNDITVEQQRTIEGLAAANAELQQTIEAQRVAAEIAAEAPRADTGAPEGIAKPGGKKP